MSKAIFLGSFNPPHKGHYNCIKSVIESGQLEHLGIDKIHIIPCRQNPNKAKFHTSFVARYKMCESMFSDLIISGKVVIDDIENEIAPEYTFDLLQYFNHGNDNRIKDDFWWIITAETLQEIIDGKWFRSSELLHDNNFIIVYGENDCLYDAIQLVKQNKICAVSVKLIDEVDYHSTQLREKIKNGQSIIEETNERVQNFITENKLYYL